MPHDTRLPQPRALILANARLVLEDEMRHRQPRGARRPDRRDRHRRGACPPGAEDCGGDFLAPGLIELHTDNLERHLEPRPGVRWPEAPAILAHDAELAGTGITTVFDALRVGSLVDGGKAGYAPVRPPARHRDPPPARTPARCASATGCTCAPRSAPRR